MSKVFREVGWLALGLAAALEITIYTRWWHWHGNVGLAALVVLFMVLQGIYYTLDGMAYTCLNEEVKTNPKALAFHNKIATPLTRTWLIDLLAVICGALCLGLSTQALASFEHDFGSDDATRKNLGLILFTAGIPLTVLFLLSSVYWFYLRRQRDEGQDGAQEFFEVAKNVWGGVEGYCFWGRTWHFGRVFLAVTLISAGLTAGVFWFGATIGVLIAVDAALALLVVGYLWDLKPAYRAWRARASATSAPVSKPVGASTPTGVQASPKTEGVQSKLGN